MFFVMICMYIEQCINSENYLINLQLNSQYALVYICEGNQALQ